MQSQIGKQRNLEHAAAEIGSKMQNAPETVTSEDAADIHSREARATGIQNPPAGSLSSQAEALAAANEGRTDSSNNGAAAAANNTVPADPAQKSQQHRVQNFEQASEQVTSKMANAPEQVTKEEGDLLHSREQRAFGATSKGGVASQAQSLAAENEKRGGTTA
ncbi:hypothetical protein B0A55_07731 [Friedmanniomyces simplex]|uniref:Uncharacterized protein n=1 Tax=Friedmanniomyces simplex TaxID=329884 RepID=A0A4U0WZD1_9PEZI|nr:hypothetical protein B0A55_07731 [Friedmanniomyces simplex]